MKSFNYIKDPDFQKWGLALALVLALGANLSFNPETKYIARNDGVNSGVFSLAQSTPTEDAAKKAAAITDGDAQKKDAPAAEAKTSAAKSEAPGEKKALAPVGLTPIDPKPTSLDLTGKYKGYTAKLVHKDGEESTGYHIVKTGTTEAGSSLCDECIQAKVGSVKLDGILKQDWSKDGLASKAILAHITAELDKLAKPAEVKAADIAKNVEIKIKGERCARPSQKELRDGGSWQEFIDCQKERMENFEETCQEKVDEKIKEAKAKKNAKVDEDIIERNVRSACKKTIDKFYTSEIKPFLETGLSQNAVPRMVRDRFGRFQITILPTETHRAAFDLLASFKDMSPDVLSKATSSQIDSQLRRGTAQSVDSTYNLIMNNARDGYASMGFDQAKSQQYASADAGRAVSTYLGVLRSEGIQVRNSSLGLSNTSGDAEYYNSFDRTYWKPTQSLFDGLNKSLLNNNGSNSSNIGRLIQDYLNLNDFGGSNGNNFGNNNNGNNNNQNNAANRDNGRRPVGNGFAGQGAGVQNLPGMPGNNTNPVMNNNNGYNGPQNGQQNGNGTPPNFPQNANGIRGPIY